jgi:radical SAM protein with 4Fe4S-binding SPASM domain
MSYIIVSIDGDERLNDKFKGKGHFKKVLENVAQLRPTYRGEIAARFTLTSENNLCESLMGIINVFDHFYWQFESSSSLKNIDIQHNKAYSDALDFLLDFWIAYMKRGKIYHIVPFQIVLRALLWNDTVDSLRCGCGSSYMFIDADGKCYLCDELIDYEQFFIGDIWNGINSSKLSNCQNYLTLCQDCSIYQICGGRCIASRIKYPHDKLLFYCDNTKTLARKMVDRLPEIKSIVENQRYTINDFKTFLSSNVFEGIP